MLGLRCENRKPSMIQMQAWLTHAITYQRMERQAPLQSTFPKLDRAVQAAREYFIRQLLAYSLAAGYFVVEVLILQIPLTQRC